MSLPSPYYQDEWVTIYHGDCREILPELPKVDLVLTDPPYGVGLDYKSYDDTRENLSILINDTLPILRKMSSLVALTCGVSQIFMYPEPDWIMCWFIGLNGIGRCKWGFNCWQPIMLWGKDPQLAVGKGCHPDVIIHQFENQFHPSHFVKHPAVKPEKTWSKLIMRLSPNSGEVILDPFLGSGTTAVCAKKLNRKCIGIEIEEKYCEISAKRCSQSVMRLEV